MRGDVIFCLGGHDTDTEPGRSTGDFRSRGSTAPRFGENTIGHSLRRITVDEEQLHFSTLTSTRHEAWLFRPGSPGCAG